MRDASAFRGAPPLPAAPARTPDDLLRDLRSRLRGDVRADAVRRGMYATDASIYQQIPVAVAVPRDAEDVLAAVAVARERGVPLLARGGGTALAGQTITEGVVLDFSKHMARVLEVDADEGWARVEPGVVRDHLNDAVKSTGLMFAPETSTSNRATLGGMIANNSSGMMSIRYGRTSEHVLELDAALADGSRALFREGGVDGAGALPRRLLDLVLPRRAEIEARWPRVLRRVGGYSLDELLKPEPDFAKFLCGSEGTLALLLGAKVRLVPQPKHVALLAAHFTDFLESLRVVPELVALAPLSIELVDGATLSLSKSNSATAHLCGFVMGEPASMLTIETTGDSEAEAWARAAEAEAVLRRRPSYYGSFEGRTAAQRKQVAEVRKAGLGVTQKTPGDAKPISFVEDSAVPVEHLADYMADVVAITRAEGLDHVVYGHASVGVLHFKPILSLKSADDLARMDRISTAVMERVRHYGGSWSGEHGDGIMRGAKNEAFWGAEITGLFRAVKGLLDPAGLMNPGKIIDTPGLLEAQRYGPGYRAGWDARWFQFRAEGGFHAAVELCNGTGACRKFGSGTMCPSFMATRDEEHTTRGRANALRLAMSGQLGPGAMTSKDLFDALDLCLECKACKSECPSNVDMAKMKSEFLAAYHAEHGASLRDRLFAHNARSAALASGPLAPLVNAVAGSAPARWLLDAVAGVDARRKPPRYAPQRFTDWHRRHESALPADAPRALLFVDTYLEHYEPEVGVWLVRLGEALGWRVEPLAAGCCQRPRISKGFLEDARREGAGTLRALAEALAPGAPVAVCEPSCLTALADDLPDLMPEPMLPGQAADRFLSAEELLLRMWREAPIRPAPPADPRPHLLHGHCHQKAFRGTDAVRALYSEAGIPLREIPSGCCGMAGSFGYEREHYELSVKIAEDRLLPAVRAMAPGTVLVASGFSCRHQISELAAVEAVHAVVAFGRQVLGGR
ncbi:MAG: FAD-linked oxidase C-terminal domain-containing protein [Candidatus Sumerlaeia bacterium]|nr:FAD-linked oxidase C-terminal domain-containing protein [Candidatus Sumerlaeia bacterium]